MYTVLTPPPDCGRIMNVPLQKYFRLCITNFFLLLPGYEDYVKKETETPSWLLT